jgi:mannosyltransferase
MPTEHTPNDRPLPETATADLHGSERRFWILSAGLLVGAFLLRVYTIGRDELWFDEAISAFAVTFADWPQELLRSNTPPLYYLLLWAWTAVAGLSETALRSFSVFSGTLFVGALLLFGRRIVGPRAALWSGLVAALAPVQIYYSQEARVYALLSLLLILGYAALWRALETSRPLWWAIHSLWALLALYSHYFAVLALAPAALMVRLWPEREHTKQRWRYYFSGMSVAVLLFLPWFFWRFYFTPRSLRNIGWIRQLWESTPPLLAIPKSLEVFTLGSEYGFTSVINVKRFGLLLMPAGLRYMGLFAAFLLAVLAAAPWQDRALGLPWMTTRKAWLWTLLLFPTAAIWLLSFYQPLYAVGRYEIVAFAGYALLLGIAFAKLQSVPGKGPVLAHLAALVFFLPVCAKLALYYQAPAVARSRPIAAAIDRLVQNGDVLVLARPQANRAIYYLSRLGYRWQDEFCENAAAGRRFLCPIYSQGEIAGRRREDEEARQAAQTFMEKFTSRDGNLWVLFDRPFVAEGQLRVGPAETWLLEELQRRKLNPAAVRQAPGLFRFE